MQLSEIHSIVDHSWRRLVTPTEKAHKYGTYNALDRSRQYEDIGVPELIKGANDAWAKIRIFEKSLDSRDAEIARLHGLVRKYKWSNIVLTSIITGLAWEGLKALVALLH